MRRKVVYSIIVVMLILTGCTIGGSFYMLNLSLTPDGKILYKDADSYPFMYRNYPFLRSWVDSLRQVNALKDTFMWLLPDPQTKPQLLYTDIRIMPSVCL